MNNLQRDIRITISELCASFERQFALYIELRDSVRSNFSKLILSRGDPGVLMAGVDKKMQLLEKIDRERAGAAGSIEHWQEYRKNSANDGESAVLNDILTRTEAVIKEFLAEEEKLKQYVEKIYKK
ncbi:MAG: hypothetical protein LBC70_00820 [Chitinispirillales bacterium]|nr:hypothetical protein [Chitinispirillales bacterium]